MDPDDVNYIQSSIAPAQSEFILNKNFPYYQKLDYENKQKFLQRLSNFVPNKKFVARQSLVVTDEMRILICACAVQLTFGLENYEIDYFDTILVYPDIYQSPHTKYTHHGEVNLQGFICFSWKSVKMGIDVTDNFNVGLHEWSHALRFNGMRGNKVDGFFEGYFAKWFAVCENVYYDIKSGKDKFFNKYGGSNGGEFFPVVIEHFFENPEKFKEKYPKEFMYTCVLLNQDPLRQLSSSFQIRNDIISKYTYTETNKVYAKSKGAPVDAARITMAIFGTVVVGAVLLVSVDKVFPDSEAIGFICLFNIVALIAVPLLMIFFPTIKKPCLTESGLILFRWGKNIKQYPWENIIQVSFLDGAGDFPLTDNFRQLEFLVDDGEDFKLLKLYISLEEKKADEYEKLFREKKVGVLRKAARPAGY